MFRFRSGVPLIQYDNMTSLKNNMTRVQVSVFHILQVTELWAGSHRPCSVPTHKLCCAACALVELGTWNNDSDKVLNVSRMLDWLVKGQMWPYMDNIRWMHYFDRLVFRDSWCTKLHISDGKHVMQGWPLLEVMWTYVLLKQIYLTSNLHMSFILQTPLIVLLLSSVVVCFCEFHVHVCCFTDVTCI